MNRKKFLSSVAALGAVLQTAGNSGTVPSAVPVIPPYLRKGDTVGIISPAGPVYFPEIQSSIEKLIEWGFRFKVGKSLGKKNFNFGGTDEERLADLQMMLDDPGISAIICARGGYGIVRIIDQLDFSLFVKKPKWIVGFSDVTILHSHIHSNYGIATIHSKMSTSFPKDWKNAEPVQLESIQSIHHALTGVRMKYRVPPSPNNIPGTAEAIVIGGNLKLIESMAGTASDLDTKGKILFVEDAGEYLYSIDRMFYNLKRTGKLAGLKALIVGGFRIKPDDPGEEFGIPLEQIILEKVKEYRYPVCFDFPVGHQKNNLAVKCGVKHRLDISGSGANLDEIQL